MIMMLMMVAIIVINIVISFDWCSYRAAADDDDRTCLGELRGRAVVYEKNPLRQDRIEPRVGLLLK